MPATTEARHPIGVVAERTGLSPDVLRVWERRYHVVEPKRSRGGQRTYSDADIERLALLRRATRGGHGISHVASLGKARLEELVREIETGSASVATRLAGVGARAVIEQAIGFARAIEPAPLELHLRRAAARVGVVAFLDDIAGPFLREIGEAWHSGALSVAQEHVASGVVERVVSDLAPLMTNGEAVGTIAVGTLEGERHAVGALMAAAAAASDGWRVIYLGADCPTEDIISGSTRARARAVGISVVRVDKKARLASALRLIAKAIAPGATLFVGGAGAVELKRILAGTGIVFLSTVAELQSKLAELGAG